MSCRYTSNKLDRPHSIVFCFNFPDTPRRDVPQYRLSRTTPMKHQLSVSCLSWSVGGGLRHAKVAHGSLAVARTHEQQRGQTTFPRLRNRAVSETSLCVISDL